MTFQDDLKLTQDQVRCFSTWQEFEQAVASNARYRRWAFRGQASTWPMFSALSRYLTDYGVHRKRRVIASDVAPASIVSR